MRSMILKFKQATYSKVSEFSEFTQLSKFTKYEYRKYSDSYESFKSRYSTIQPGQTINSHEKIKGRIISLRDMSKHLKFGDISLNGQTLQFVTKFNSDFVKRGNIVEICGFPYRTKTGELSILINDIKILKEYKILLPPSARFDKNNIEDPFLKYQKRYLDLITNHSSIATFQKRSLIIQFVRNYLINEGFLEVETPILSKGWGVK